MLSGGVCLTPHVILRADFSNGCWLFVDHGAQARAVEVAGVGVQAYDEDVEEACGRCECDGVVGRGLSGPRSIGREGEEVGIDGVDCRGGTRGLLDELVGKGPRRPGTTVTDLLHGPHPARRVTEGRNRSSRFS